jgi:methyl-accepting chemotaxis protein
MRPIIIAGCVLISVLALSRVLRRKRSGPIRRTRKEVKRAVSDVEGTIEDLTARAKKLNGEAKETIEVQVRALQDRREQLVERLNSIAADAKKQSKKARETAAVAAE